MKNFFQFISEARQSKASERAKQLGLKGDGHGGWYNSSGEFVAKTEGGDLKFYNKGERPGRDVPPETNNRQVDNIVKKQDLPKNNSLVGNKLTIVFGRFNPPTKKHQQLFTTAKSISGDSDLKIYPSRSQDSENNPLSPDTKIEYMKKMFPKFADNIINDDEMISLFDVLETAENDGYREITIVVGTDRLSEFRSLALKHNGSLYNFKDITVVGSGEKQSDFELASRMRSFAANDDLRSFKSGLPKTLNDADVEKLFKLVRKGIGVSSKNENIDMWKLSPKLNYGNLREYYIRGKIFRKGSLIESLNTGLIGRIIRRGTNYLICATEDNKIMFKSWIYDVIEKKEHEVPSKKLDQLISKSLNRVDNNIDGFVDKNDPKTGPYGAFIPQMRNIPKVFKIKEWTDISGVPASNREVGTDEYRNYAMKMMKVEKIKNFINKYKVKK